MAFLRRTRVPNEAEPASADGSSWATPLSDATDEEEPAPARGSCWVSTSHKGHGGGNSWIPHTGRGGAQGSTRF